MGNFTSSSWGLVQMKTNGEADSSQVSGNCRGKEAKERQDQFSVVLRRGLHGKDVKPQDARCCCDESFSERACLYIVRDVLRI